MSSVNYDLNKKGVRLISSEDAWVKSKNGKYKLNPKIKFLGKIDSQMPNMIISPTDNKKPKYKGDIKDLNRTAKGQIIDYFYNDFGRRNKKRVAYFGIKK